MPAEFKPINELEDCLVQAQEGKVSPSVFMDKLWTSQVLTLIDKDIDPAGVWDNTASPLILANRNGDSVMALFTALERSVEWPKRFPQFCFALLTNFSWLIKGVAPGVGIVVNPGSPAGLELSAERVQQMRTEAARSA
ncbi:SseB family protein [Herbaspirillum sp. ST 5-3]|uniref:SseB family protein n=1 Tax=Oxalobacteraceae TaxID=75682 RepID=UPI0014561C27|nr:SseB family protein [Herbaspirillum sp. ST 5-3]